jgi:hypothetical protein
MQMDFTIPGTLGPRITAKRNLLGNVQLYADDLKLARHGWFRSYWAVPASDGRTYELRLARNFTTTKIRVDGHELVLERQLLGWEMALVVLPLGFILLGGLIGGLFGAAAAEVNRRVARSELRAPARVVGMLGVTLATAAAWFGTTIGIGILVTPVPEYTAGNCYREWHGGAGLADDSLTLVDCAVAHETEVVANIEHPDGPYPGADALLGFGNLACRAPFEAYVGVPYETSSLSMLISYPEDLLWLKGDRTIDCFVTAPNGRSLTGSVRDTGQ